MPGRGKGGSIHLFHWWGRCARVEAEGIPCQDFPFQCSIKMTLSPLPISDSVLPTAQISFALITEIASS